MKFHLPQMVASFMLKIMTMYVLYIDGEDYTGNSMTVNTPAGVTTQPLTINIINNNIVECDETFNVTIVSVTTCGVTIGSNNISEVMITDYGKHKFIMINFCYRKQQKLSGIKLLWFYGFSINRESFPY